MHYWRRQKKKMISMDLRGQAISLISQYNTNDPFEICDLLNIKIMRWPLGNMRGYFYQNENGKVIVLNNSLEQYAEKFVCAHELGHYILHGGLNRVFLDSQTFLNTAKCEKEANAFAMLFLYPDDKEFLEYGETIENISIETGCRDELVELRLFWAKNNFS